MARLAHEVRSHGWVDIALATDFAKVSDLAGLDGVLAAARATGQMSSRLVLSAIRARFAQRQCAVSRRILEEGRVAGLSPVRRLH